MNANTKEVNRWLCVLIVCRFSFCLVEAQIATVSTLSPDWGISDAIVGGSVSTGSNSAFVWFDWGGDTNYGNSTQAYPVPEGLVSLDFSNRITGLEPYTTYHYQAVASNALGIVRGQDATFATAPRFVPTIGSNGNWSSSIGWSADGSKLFSIASNTLYLTTNSGAVWMPISEAGLTIFAVSSDGNKIIGLNGSNLYATTNLGATWSSNSTPVAFYDFAGSADLERLAAIAGGNIYVSTNSGMTWTLTDGSTKNWVGIVSTADGVVLYAMQVDRFESLFEYSPYVFLSTNGGITWDEIYNAPGFSLGYPYEQYGLVSSANGSIIFLTDYFYALSTNSGMTWKSGGLSDYGAVPNDSYSAACSADGTVIIATTTYNGIYVSPDSGVNWFLANTASTQGTDLISVDGRKFISTAYGTNYISEANPMPLLSVGVASNCVLLSWMLPTTDFVLQQSSDLVNWTTVTNVPQLSITNLQNQVVLPVCLSQSFYRLRTQ